ncbi:hypothetical protein IE53DRAFT_72203 [Violaceomyces palustris]|uniref:Uncharacterized protein n=1 Tax=Violaceomyces palustris TaxID=1673888 RepID=A0ACD0NYQ7_9BASI|nr:hypothetical protein IE53DRAFT_72203 [Violaceomyces palustris]
MQPLNAFGYFFSSVSSIFKTSVSSVQVPSQNATYSILLHSPKLVLYQGAETHITFSLVASPSKAGVKVRVDPSIIGNVNVQLVKKGWRAGLFGWDAAAYMGAKTKSGWDITPADRASWNEAQLQESKLEDEEAEAEMYKRRSEQEDDEQEPLLSNPETPSTRSMHIGPKRKAKIESDIKSHFSLANAEDSSSPGSRVIGTFKARIPIESGDGYFRLFALVPISGSSSKVQLPSPTFRVFSFSLSSASPRGATLLPLPTLAPELVLRSLSILLSTLLFAMFPVVSIIDKILPRWMSRRFVRWVYRSAGGEKKKRYVMERMHVDQKIHQAKSAVQKVPFASAGVRTEWDLRSDQARGRGGWSYTW